MHLFLHFELELGKSKELITNGKKYNSKRLLKAIFSHQKNNKKGDRLCMKFSLTSNTSVQRCLYPLFQNQCPHFLLSPLFWKLSSQNYLNPKVRINKMVNKHTVDYDLSPSRLPSRIYPLIFLWTSKGLIAPESLLKYFLNLYIPPWFQKNVKFMVKITGKYICPSKN